MGLQLSTLSSILKVLVRLVTWGHVCSMSMSPLSGPRIWCAVDLAQNWPVTLSSNDQRRALQFTSLTLSFVMPGEAHVIHVTSFPQITMITGCSAKLLATAVWTGWALWEICHTRRQITEQIWRSAWWLWMRTVKAESSSPVLVNRHPTEQHTHGIPAEPVCP